MSTVISVYPGSVRVPPEVSKGSQSAVHLLVVWGVRVCGVTADRRPVECPTGRAAEVSEDLSALRRRIYAKRVHLRIGRFAW